MSEVMGTKTVDVVAVGSADGRSAAASTPTTAVALAAAAAAACWPVHKI